jgi:predicted esterase
MAARGEPMRFQAPRTRVVFAVMIVCLAGCSTGTTAVGSGSTFARSPTLVPTPVAPTRDPATLFARLHALTEYPSDPVPSLTVRSRRASGAGITVSDASYSSPAGGTVSAWLVEPDAAGPHPAIVYLHGSETDRDDLLDEAVAVARGGAVSLVLDAPFAEPGADRRQLLQRYDDVTVEQRVNAIAVMNVLRALDILAARPDIDPGRLGFVGHSWGANIGIDVAARDSRLHALVLLVPRPSWTGYLTTADASWVRAARFNTPAAAWARYLEEMAPFDAVPLVRRIEGASVFVQYGSADGVIPREVSQQLVEALPAGAQTSYYTAGHALNADATADRIAWLVERLGLGPVPASIVAKIGLPDE